MKILQCTQVVNSSNKETEDKIIKKCNSKLILNIQCFDK